MLTKAGLKLSLDPSGGIRVEPRSILTDELRATIRSHREELLAVLSAPAVCATGDASRTSSTTEGGLLSGFPADDRIRCHDCLHLTGRGVCRTAGTSEGPTGTVRGYSPVLDLLRRCEAFRPRFTH